MLIHLKNLKISYVAVKAIALALIIASFLAAAHFHKSEPKKNEQCSVCQIQNQLRSCEGPDNSTQSSDCFLDSEPLPQQPVSIAARIFSFSRSPRAPPSA